MKIMVLLGILAVCMGALTMAQAQEDQNTQFTTDSRGGYVATTIYADGSTATKSVSIDRNGNLDSIRRTSTPAIPAPTPYVPAPVATNHEHAKTRIEMPIVARPDVHQPLIITEGKVTAPTLSAAEKARLAAELAAERSPHKRREFKNGE